MHRAECRQEEPRPLPDDPLSALDARINLLRGVRAAAARFSDAFWEADDALAWLRVARDELLRTGRVRDEVATFLGLTPTGVSVEPDRLDATQPPTPLTAIGAATATLASERDEPIVAA
jgi:hypothetical protein